jgi:menaquinone-dependent protoporphyrinogen oxidase
MAKIIIIYSTTDGHTREICEHLQRVIEKRTNQVVLVSINDETEIDLNSFDKIVIGASIRYGKHRPRVYKFINKNLPILKSKPNAFFTVNVVARKPEKNHPETNPYLLKFLRQIPWKPKKLAVFAGKINYQKYKFSDRMMIRLIMWITKGPTHPNTNINFTDWSQVEDFGELISEM